jgi:hypothetical protein
MPRPTSVYQRSKRRSVTIPGLLMLILKQRWEEFRYPCFAPYALELICFDLRKRREHIVTLAFARETRRVQQALDRELVRHYQPGRREGILARAVQGGALDVEPPRPRGDFAQEREFLSYSETLAPCVETRWREAGYASFSAYLTGVIRYDLLLLGPHKYFSGDDTDPEILESLDRGTVADFQAARPQPTYLDVLINQAAGRRLPPEERDEATRKVAARLKEMVLAARG